VIFFMTGWVYAAWATRIPSIKDELGLSDGALALAILGLEAGAIVGLPLGGALVARVGSRRALRLGFAGLPTALFASRSPRGCSRWPPCWPEWPLRPAWSTWP
jgi:MFS family permease